MEPKTEKGRTLAAPDDRKDKVIQEISRPVFTLLEKGPLSELCSYISYASICELENEKYIEHMTDSVVQQFAEYTRMYNADSYWEG